ncbi:hypothetical protein L1987_44119 [Smallanthus sonchifolius]|uniref:Uncharacterized protein n=1 Tax=Smallanthus sonchifolius TaxID=185202 RepID=A0ACB9GPK3_9ASTR|nr:hypothetical protein L1987_44119 [Smallanthus sonchifolius]
MKMASPSFDPGVSADLAGTTNHHPEKRTMIRKNEPPTDLNPFGCRLNAGFGPERSEDAESGRDLKDEVDSSRDPSWSDGIDNETTG